MKFYFATTTASDVNPSFDGSWEQQGSALRRKLLRERDGSALTDLSVTIPITTTQDILCYQYVSEPLPFGFNFGANINIVIRCSENANSNNAFLAYIFRIVSLDGGTARGTVASKQTTTGATEFPLTASAATRIWTDQSPTSNVIAQPSDRIVLELGIRANAPTAAGSGILRRGCSAATDFALTSGLTTDLNPWFEIIGFNWGGVGQQNYNRWSDAGASESNR